MDQPRTPGHRTARTITACCALLASLFTVPVVAQVQDNGWRPDGYFLEVGRSARDTSIAGVGLRWNWAWQAQRWGGHFSGGTELSVAYWRATTLTGRSDRAHFALIPLLRFRPSAGASPWFVEGGIGLSLHPEPYEAEDIRMSTRLNFYDVLAVGRSVGPGELSLRAVHVSNAGIRRPNPGADIVMLRWSQPF
ncbi:acyloxyacyl hydrolase [Ramlibacter rhizophilus]|nr:acyloxyacyl hydrolase [Ramlibacter rhizophilus]